MTSYAGLLAICTAFDQGRRARSYPKVVVNPYDSEDFGGDTYAAWQIGYEYDRPECDHEWRPQASPTPGHVYRCIRCKATCGAGDLPYAQLSPNCSTEKTDE